VAEIVGLIKWILKKLWPSHDDEILTPPDTNRDKNKPEVEKVKLTQNRIADAKPGEQEGIEALGTLYRKVEWGGIAEDAFDYRKNRCWALQVAVQLASKSTDGTEISEIMSKLARLITQRDMKRFSWKCLGLAPMVTGISQLCCKLYTGKHNIKDMPSDRVREVSLEGILACTNLVSLYSERPSEEELRNDSAIAIASFLKLLQETLSKCSSEWAEMLHVHLTKFFHITCCILREPELKHKDIQKELQAFSEAIPPALRTLAKSGLDVWLNNLQELCQTLPHKQYGYLFMLWKRVTVVSRKNGFVFLGSLIDATLEPILKEARAMRQKGATDKRAYTQLEYIVGCINDLLSQCLRWHPEKLSTRWIEVSLPIRQYLNQFREEDDPNLKNHEEYLEQMDEKLMRSLQSDAVSQEPTLSKNWPPRKLDPNDSLCGTLY